MVLQKTACKCSLPTLFCLNCYQAGGKKTNQVNPDVLFCKAHMHILQTQKINEGGTPSQISSDHHAARDGRWICCPLVPQCLQEGQNTGGWVPMHCQEHNRNTRFQMMRTYTESKLIQVIPYGERTKERDQYDLKQPFHRKSLTSDCTPVEDTRGKPVLLGSEVSSGLRFQS